MPSRGNLGGRFSRNAATPSGSSGPEKPRNSMPSDASKIGPAARSQLLSAYLVQRIAFGAPSASRSATSSARACSSSSRHRQRHEADALGLLAGDGVAQQQIVLGLGHAAEERPDDRGVIAGGDAELGVTVDQPRGLAAIEMSARIATTSPAPTAAPLIAETTGLLQLIRL